MPSSPTAVVTTSTSSMPSTSSGTAAPRSGDTEPVVFHTVGVQLPGFIESTFTHDGVKLYYEEAGSGTPIVIDGVMYVSGVAGRVYALDASSGAVLWQFEPSGSRK